MELVPLSSEVVAPLKAFFGRIPESDHSSFAEDVFEPGLVESWLQDARGRRSVAVEGDQVVGYLAVLPLVGWSAHVGSVRIVVDPAVRGKGVGRALSRSALLTGLELGLTKLVVEVVADAAPAVAMFEKLGFEPEALLRDHVRDRNGDLRDLLVLAHFVEGNWSSMAMAGLEDELA